MHGVAGRPEFCDIHDALAVLERAVSHASLMELQVALSSTLQTLAQYGDILNPRYRHYDAQQNGDPSGGSSGGNGRGNGDRSAGGGDKSVSFNTAGSPRFLGDEPFVANYKRSYVVGTNGKWELISPTQHEWISILNGGMRLANRWGRLAYNYGDHTETHWYHFGQYGTTDFGWYRDEAMSWYHLDRNHDGLFGRMQIGWHLDDFDQYWCCSDESSGVIQTGWQELGGKWYYFAPAVSAETYEYGAVGERWYYKDNAMVRLYGSIYQNEVTSDGHRTDATGVWIPGAR